MTRRPTKAELAHEARLRAAFDAGAEYHADHLEDLLAAVHQHATELYGELEEILAFVGGFMAQRIKRDTYLIEKQIEQMKLPKLRRPR